MPPTPKTGTKKLDQQVTTDIEQYEAFKALFTKWQKDGEPPAPEMDIDDNVAPFDGASKAVYVAEKGIRVESREVDFIASTADMDSDGEIVEQDFVYERFQKNPVILFAHNSRALPIGKATNVRVEGGLAGNLKLTVQFASKAANPLAENVFLLIKEKILRAMSIGFIPRDIRREMRDEKEVYILSNNELLEASIVPIPANPNALAEMKAKALEKFKAAPLVGQEQAAAGGQGSSMNLEELQAKMADLDEQHKALAEKHEALTELHGTVAEELDALKVRYTSLEELRNEEVKRANTAELANIERDLDELILASKIYPKEKASLLKTAEVSRELYAEQIAAIKDRPSMNLCEPTVLPDEKTVPRELSENQGPTFASFVNRRAGLNS